GRDAEIQELTDRVRRAPLTVLYGVSGYGKSSLLGAGLIPELTTTGYAVALLRRCYDDLGIRSLSLDIMREVAAQQPGVVLPDPEEPIPTLWELCPDRRQPWLPPEAQAADEAEGAEAGEASSPTSPLRPVVILDQFEQIFTKGEDYEKPEPPLPPARTA